VLGRSKNQTDRYEASDAADKQTARIPAGVLAALADHSKLPIEWLETGRQMERKPPIIRGTAEELLTVDEDVPLQKLAFKVAAGHGALIMDEAAGYVRFPRAILAHIGVSPQHARLMEAAGESMKATINDGDLMLVDVSPNATQIVEGKIYVSR
jgi:phage repressor protein C with HTH and peptisase S24 domain